MNDMIRLTYGNTNTYFVNGLLIDADMPHTLSAFFAVLGKNGLTLSDIRYVLATHYHPDHIGLIGELMSRGVTLLLADRQTPFVHSSDALFARIPHCPFVPIDETKATVFSLPDSRAILAPVGIAGEIVPTNSHSPDGIALLLDDGHAFVGDLEPLSFLEGYENNISLQDDWKRILSHAPHTIHFGHANDFRP